MIRMFVDCGVDMVDVQYWCKINIDIYGDYFVGYQLVGFGGQFVFFFYF